MQNTPQTTPKNSSLVNVGENLYTRNGDGTHRFVGKVISKSTERTPYGYDSVALTAVRRDRREEIRSKNYFKPHEQVYVA